MRRAGNIGTILEALQQYFRALRNRMERKSRRLDRNATLTTTDYFLLFLSSQKKLIFMTNLPPVAQKFVLHWGEMGTRWGINRTVAQVHALLFLSEKPLPADEIAATLGIARSNTSTSLRELQNWGIVRIVHVLGDRRDHFAVDQRCLCHVPRDRAPAEKARDRPDGSCPARLPGGGGQTENGRCRISAVACRTFWISSKLAGAAYERLEKLPTPAVLKLAKLGDRACAWWAFQNSRGR